MLDFGGKTLLQRQLAAYKESDVEDISLIRGYKKEKIKYKGIKYFAISAGPKVLTEKILLNDSLLRCLSDFSGLILSSESIPVVTIITSKGPASEQILEALDIELSLSISMETLCILEKELATSLLDNA